MDFQKHFTTGWQNTLEFIGPVLLLTLAQLIISIVSLGFLAPVTFAGYTKSLLQAQRHGRVPEIRDLFSELSLFLPLFIFGAVLTILVWAGFLLLVLPGVILSLAISFGCLYVIPLVVDKELGVFEALQYSWELSLEKPLTDQIIIAVVYAGILSVGGSFFITMLFAMPLASFILLAVYDDRLSLEDGAATED